MSKTSLINNIQWILGKEKIAYTIEINSSDYNLFQTQMRTSAFLTPIGSYNSKIYSYSYQGNSLTLQSRLQGLSDQDVNSITDASVIIQGVQIHEKNYFFEFCTIIWAAILIFPLFLFFCNAWKKCAYAAYDVPLQTYKALGKLLRGQNLKSLSLTVIDNCFNLNKAQVLYGLISESNIKGFMFINCAQSFGFNNNEYSSFQENMKSIRSLTKVITDIRWRNTDCN